MRQTFRERGRKEGKKEKRRGVESDAVKMQVIGELRLRTDLSWRCMSRVTFKTCPVDICHHHCPTSIHHDPLSASGPLYTVIVQRVSKDLEQMYLLRT